MMPKTLFETTLNPATRRLLQVIIPDGAQVETERVLSRLMGKDSAPRYAEIMERARTVEALDV
jgi:DNA gyrase/topoisomerase IV subunit B